MEQNRERLASLGTMAAGLAHELNNPAAAARRAAAELSEAVDTVVATLSRFVEAGVEREAAEGLVALQRRGAARRRSPLPARRARRRRRRGRAARRARGARGRRGVAARRAARRRGRRRGLAGAHARAGRRRDDRRRAVGGGDADRAHARRRRAGVDRRGCRRSSARSRPTPTWTAASWSRSTCTRAWRPRSPCSATSSSTRRSRSCATTTATLRKLTVHGSELNQVWTNLLDNAIDALGGARHDHDPHRAARATRALVADRRRRPRHPARGARARLRRLLHDQGRRPGHRPRPGDRAADRRRPPRRRAHGRVGAGATVFSREAAAMRAPWTGA